MTHLRIEQNNIPETVTSTSVHKLYEETVDQNYISGNLKGNLQVPRAYRDEVEFLETKFPDLHINVTAGYYFKFRDPIIHNYFSSMYGDGVGVSESTVSTINNIDRAAFENNTQLVSFDELSDMNVKQTTNNQFAGCSNLESIDTSNLTSVSEYTFQNCGKLEFLDLHNISGNIETGICNNCTSLKKVILGDVINIGTRWNTYKSQRPPFSNCTSLTTLDIKSIAKVGNDKNMSLRGVDSMRNFIIRSENVPTFTDDLTSTDISYFGGSNVTIYVPDSAVQTYKSATGWESVAKYIQPLSNYVEDSV